MTTMKSYVNVLREMFDDVTANVAGARECVADCESTIGRVNEELEVSGSRLAAIKESFSVWKIVKAKKKSGISAEEAREEANRLSEYANTVDMMSVQQRMLGDAEVSLRAAEDRVGKTENVQQKLTDLMDALGMIVE